MPDVPTDVIANELAVRLFLFGLAAMSFYEALKAERPRSYIPWAASALFALSGAFLTPLARVWPIGVATTGEIVASPVSWFVLFVSFFFVARPYWQRSASNTPLPTPDPSVLSQMQKRLTALETRKPEQSPIPATEGITPTSHKGKPLARLSAPERERISTALLAVGDYLETEFTPFLRTFKELQNASTILRLEGGTGYHAKVEAPRPTLRALIDSFVDAIKPYEREMLLLDIDWMAIKTKALPLWDAVLELSNVSQLLPHGSANGVALKLPLRRLGEVVETTQAEVDRVQSEITRYRLKISRGEL